MVIDLFHARQSGCWPNGRPNAIVIFAWHEETARVDGLTLHNRDDTMEDYDAHQQIDPEALKTSRICSYRWMRRSARVAHGVD
jgi:hypothetical protein